MVQYLFMSYIILLYTLNHIYVTYDVKHKAHVRCVVAIMSGLGNNKNDVCACIAEMLRKNKKGQVSQPCFLTLKSSLSK